MSEKPTTPVLSEQSQEVVEYWYEKALDRLVDGAHIPFSDEVWDSDKYTDRIFALAQEMFEDEFGVLEQS
jgi:hypothetical protein